VNFELFNDTKHEIWLAKTGENGWSWKFARKIFFVHYMGRILGPEELFSETWGTVGRISAATHGLDGFCSFCVYWIPHSPNWTTMSSWCRNWAQFYKTLPSDKLISSRPGFVHTMSLWSNFSKFFRCCRTFNTYIILNVVWVSRSSRNKYNNATIGLILIKVRQQCASENDDQSFSEKNYLFLFNILWTFSNSQFEITRASTWKSIERSSKWVFDR